MYANSSMYAATAKATHAHIREETTAEPTEDVKMICLNLYLLQSNRCIKPTIYYIKKERVSLSKSRRLKRMIRETNILNLWYKSPSRIPGYGKTKTLIICQNCQKPFTQKDPRGQPLYCPTCKQQKKNEAVKKSSHAQYLRRKQGPQILNLPTQLPQALISEFTQILEKISHANR